jgi:eukaryotic-like serine/threonine-protein kinase
MTSLTATGQVIAGRYELTRFIAGGAMGEVWEANDNRMGRAVAVKVLRPDYARDPVAVARFRTEARLAARLTHPGIAMVHDVDDGSSPDEPPWMVQELVPGRPLSELIAITGGIDPFRVATLIAQAADAVHAAHGTGVVHRDLTPGNLLVCDGDVVKITDFGIARASGVPALTATGQVLGAAAYLAPEQVRGEPASPASDIYTLGVVLHECLTGARPFSGANPVEVAQAHLHRQPPPLPASVPEQLRAITADAMAKDPADRPGSAAELATRLRGVNPARPPSAPRRAPAWDWFASAPGPVAARPSVAAGETRTLPTVSPSGSPPATVSSAPAVSPPPSLPQLVEGSQPNPDSHVVDKPPQDAPSPVAVPAPARSTPPLRPQPPAPVATGAAAVRMATRPRPRSAGASSGDLVHRTGELWRRHPVSRIGVAGGVVLLLVVLAVLWGGSGANAEPGIDMDGPGAGTVPVGGGAGKGAE